MRVTQQNNVDAGHLPGDGDARVFIRHLRRIARARAQIFFDTHVHRDGDHVDFFLLAQD